MQEHFKNNLGHGRHMESDCNFNEDNGLLLVTTKTWSTETFRGFTGSVFVWFADENDKVLDVTDTHTYGVNANSSRTEHWTYNVNTDIVKNIKKMHITHYHSPRPRTENLPLIGKTIAEIIAALG